INESLTTKMLSLAWFKSICICTCQFGACKKLVGEKIVGLLAAVARKTQRLIYTAQKMRLTAPFTTRRPHRLAWALHFSAHRRRLMGSTIFVPLWNLSTLA